MPFACYACLLFEEKIIGFRLQCVPRLCGILGFRSKRIFFYFFVKKCQLLDVFFCKSVNSSTLVRYCTTNTPHIPGCVLLNSVSGFFFIISRCNYLLVKICTIFASNYGFSLTFSTGAIFFCWGGGAYVGTEGQDRSPQIIIVNTMESISGRYIFFFRQIPSSIDMNLTDNCGVVEVAKGLQKLVRRRNRNSDLVIEVLDLYYGLICTMWPEDGGEFCLSCGRHGYPVISSVVDLFGDVCRLYSSQKVCNEQCIERAFCFFSVFGVL